MQCSDISCHVQPRLATDFQPWHILHIFAAELKKSDVSPKRIDNEKKNFIGISRSVGRRCCLRPRPGTGRHQRGDKPHDLVLRPCDKAVLRHRRSARPRRRHKDLQQVFQRRPGHVQDSRLVVFRLHLPDRCGDNPPFLLPLSLWSTP